MKRNEQNSSRSRYCKRHQKHHHRQECLTKSPPISNRSRTTGDDFGRKILDEITRIDARCAQMRELEEATRKCQLEDTLLVDLVPNEGSRLTLEEEEDEAEKDFLDIRSNELGIDREAQDRWDVSGS